MQQTAYFILAALVEEPLHGYGIIRRARELSNGDIELRAGTLYGALRRLERDDMVALDREEVVLGRLRRYYRLSAVGHAALRDEAERAVRAGRLAARLGVLPAAAAR